MVSSDTDRRNAFLLGFSAIDTLSSLLLLEEYALTPDE